MQTWKGTYRACPREATGVSTQCLPERKGLGQGAEAEDGRSCGSARDCDIMEIDIDINIDQIYKYASDFYI